MARRRDNRIQASEFFATKKHKNYGGFDGNLPRAHRRNENPAAAPVPSRLFVAKPAWSPDASVSIFARRQGQAALLSRQNFLGDFVEFSMINKLATMLSGSS